MEQSFTFETLTRSYQVLALAWLKYIGSHTDSPVNRVVVTDLAKDICKVTEYRKVKPIEQAVAALRKYQKEFENDVMTTFLKYCNELTWDNVIYTDENIIPNPDLLKRHYKHTVEGLIVNKSIVIYIICDLFLDRTKGKKNENSQTQKDQVTIKHQGFNPPVNLQSGNILRDLEFTSQDIIVNVVTPNLGWALRYLNTIIKSAQELNSYHYYLLTTSNDETRERKRKIEREVNKFNLNHKIQIIDLVKQNEISEEYKVDYDGPFPKEGNLFIPMDNSVVFPLPYDFVVYENIQNKYIKVNSDFVGRSSDEDHGYVGAIGSTPYSYNVEYKGNLDYYDLLMHPRKAEKLLNWFNNVWEAITGSNKYPQQS